jgi:lysophospholipase L1-like esterase
MAARWPVNALRGALNVNVENFGIGGDRIENTVWLLDQLRKNGTPLSTLILFVGTNNVRTDNECDFRVKLDRLARVARERFGSSPIYLVNILPKGIEGRAFADRIERANKVYRDIASTYSLILLDAHAAVESRCKKRHPCELFDSDRIHLSGIGYEFMTKLIAGARAPRGLGTLKNTTARQ